MEHASAGASISGQPAGTWGISSSRKFASPCLQHRSLVQWRGAGHKHGIHICTGNVTMHVEHALPAGACIMQLTLLLAKAGGATIAGVEKCKVMQMLQQGPRGLPRGWGSTSCSTR